MKSGFISIIGRPNTGKSTLLNAILGTHLAIVSNVAGTTRNSIQGVYNDDDTQIIFIDTPGIHKPKDKLGRFLNRESYDSLEDIDAILFIADATTPPGRGDAFILNQIKERDIPVLLVLNKIDKMNDEQILNAINQYKDIYDFDDIIPVSALKSDNITRLINVIKKYLSDDIKYYDDGVITNTSTYFMISELVREKILNLTTEEVPHSINCVTTYYKDKGNIIDIYVDIIIDRDPLKRIIIGHQGSMLKKIGSMARQDIEKLLGKQVYLELYVKTVKKWRDKETYIEEIGLKTYE